MAEGKNPLGNFGYSTTPSFSGLPTFFGQPYTQDLQNVDIAVSGVPFDCATSNRSGTRFGPRGIREASLLQIHEPPYGWDVDAFSDYKIIDYGDVQIDYGDVRGFPQRLQNHVSKILDQNVTSLVLGGDHYITYPILKAHAEIHGRMSLLQFDAHSDTWKANEPTDIDHGTMLYHAINEGLIDPGSSVQVGIRTTNQEPMGMNIIDSFEVHEKGAQFVADKIREILGNNPTYLTFDIDSLDPAYAPGTGTPVWGGLTPIQVTVILRKIMGINVIGMDVVEVSPPYDTSGITSVAGAHVAVDLICLWASGK